MRTLSKKLVGLTLVPLLVLVAGLSSPAYAVQYSGVLGPESVGATGSGSALVTIDMDLLTLRLETSFSGLSGLTTVSHIHCCTATPGAGPAGVATQTPTFVGFPQNVSAGSYDQTFDMTLASSYNAAFITNNGGTTSSAFNALIAGLDAGKAYLNIHSTTYPGGEIRAFLTVVPEPGTALLLGLGLLGLARRSRPRA